MVDRFARRWAAALTGDDRVDGSASAVAELRPLVVRPARVVAADRADDALAHDVCAVLAGVGRMAGVVPALLTLLDGLGVTVDVAAGHLRDPSCRRRSRRSWATPACRRSCSTSSSPRAR